MMMQVFAGGGTCEATNAQQDEDKEGSARNVLAGGHTPRLALLPVGDCVRRRCFCLMNPSFSSSLESRDLREIILVDDIRHPSTCTPSFRGARPLAKAKCKPYTPNQTTKQPWRGSPNFPCCVHVWELGHVGLNEWVNA